MAKKHQPPASPPEVAPPTPGGSPHRRALLLAGAAILVVTALVYAPVRHHGFVNYDDPLYVEDNAAVQGGLSWPGLRWALTSGHASNWHPLTWLSHMLDVELFGTGARGPHLHNLLLHLAAALVLLLALYRLTGRPWPSALVAALFALHPCHVESVAWISERKDVLSTLLLGGVLWAYAAYVERPGRGRYLAVVGLLALGLMAKPMLVTVPLLLLLLDLWPLRRLPAAAGAGFVATLGALLHQRRLLREKLPLLALALASSAVTFAVQRAGGAVSDLEQVPLLVRLGNAAVAYVAYLGKALWPQRLAVLYPYPAVLPVVQAVAAALLLALLTVLAVRAWRQRPYLAAGWLWFLGTLVPVIGLVQVGVQAMADRYTYVPFTGLFLILAWSAAELADRRAQLRPILVAAALVALAALAVASHRQVLLWRDSVTLFEHTLAVTRDNHHMHDLLGVTLLKDGQVTAAVPHFQEAVRLRPGFAPAHNNLGVAAMRLGRPDEAAGHFRAAARLAPGDAEARNNLGNALAELGRFAEALAAYREALALAPEDAGTRHNLALTLVQTGQPQAALEHFAAALRLDGSRAAVHSDLANTLARLGRPEEARQHYQEALRLDPGNAAVHLNLATLLAVMGQLPAAAEHCAEAVRLAPENPRAHFLLGLTRLSLGDRAGAQAQLARLQQLDPAAAAELARQLAASPGPP